MNRLTHKLIAINGYSPPMHKHASPRRRAFELIRYRRWNEYRWKVTDHRHIKLDRLIARFFHDGKRLWMDTK